MQDVQSRRTQIKFQQVHEPLPVEHEHRHDGAELDNDLERLLPLSDKVEQMTGNDHMSRRRDRQKLC
ncbi:hypothetical protein D3C84_924340 [compost metagenome]